MGGSAAGSAIRLSAIRDRKAASGAALHGSNRPRRSRAARSISARPPTVRQIRSGSRPMIE
jgi:hypothetical protein